MVIKGLKIAFDFDDHCIVLNKGSIWEFSPSCNRIYSIAAPEAFCFFQYPVNKYFSVFWVNIEEVIAIGPSLIGKVGLAFVFSEVAVNCVLQMEVEAFGIDFGLHNVNVLIKVFIIIYMQI